MLEEICSMCCAPWFCGLPLNLLSFWGSLRLLRKLDSGFDFRQALYKCKGGNSALVELQSVGILPHSWILAGVCV
jgi:hypothetical protein